MRSAFTVSVRFLAKLLWSIAKAIIAIIAWMVCVVLVVGLTQELIQAVGLYDYAYDVAHGIRLGVSAVVMIIVGHKLCRWVSGQNWFAEIGPKRATKLLVPPVARSPTESLWFFAKAVLALVAWIACVGLVGYALFWLSDAMALEGLAADLADGLSCALWLVVAFAVGFRLQAWVEGERWRGLSHWPPDYQRPGYAPESEKSGRG